MASSRGRSRIGPIALIVLLLILGIVLVGRIAFPSRQVLAQPTLTPLRPFDTNFVLPAPCNGSGTKCFLTKNSSGGVGIGDSASASLYYTNIGAAGDTLSLFKQRNGFGDPANEIHAVYFNNGDLQLGRDMHCREGAEVSPGNHSIACYVSNYGPKPFDAVTGKPGNGFPDPTGALANAIAQTTGVNGLFATVAMEYSPIRPITLTIRVGEESGITANPDPPRGCLFGGGPNILPPLTNRDVDSGVDIEPGDEITFVATGTIWAGWCNWGETDANGLFDSAASDYPLPGAKTDSLIGRIGSGPYFSIGTSRTISASQRGRLFLRTNDNNPGNGFGAFNVAFTVVTNRMDVKFYVYKDDGTLQLDAALDSEGPKYVPQMCLTCHGGFVQSNRVQGASFLPFDVFSFLYSTQPTFTRAAQEERFAKLNLLVTKTHPNPPIASLIFEDWYKNSGVKAENGVPSGWAGQEDLYRQVVNPVCRECHLAMQPSYDFTTYEKFKNLSAAVKRNVCDQGEMPQAQVPYKHLQTLRVTRKVATELRELGISCLAGPDGPPTINHPGRIPPR